MQGECGIEFSDDLMTWLRFEFRQRGINRITGERKALVLDCPGVTRDRNYAIATWVDTPFVLVDTGGFEPEPGDALFAAMRRQSEAAVTEADVVVLLVEVWVCRGVGGVWSWGLGPKTFDSTRETSTNFGEGIGEVKGELPLDCSLIGTQC